MSDKYNYIINKGLTIFRTDAKQNFASIITLATLLFLYMAVFTVNHSVSAAIGALSDSQTIRVFINDEADNKRVEASIMTILPEGDVKYYDRNGAKNRVIDISPNSDNLKELPVALFPRFFEIKLKNPSAVHMANAEKNIDKVDGVKSVETGKKMNERLQRVKSTSGMFVMMLTLLTGISCAFIVFNTIRLSLFRHHRSIMIYTLVGATRDFITYPFVVASKLEVTLAFIVALVMNKIFVWYVTSHMLQDSFFVLSAPSMWSNIFLYVVMLAIAALSAIFSVVTFLMRQKSINEI